MAYPLLVPREQASQCLQYERELAPLVGIVAPDPSVMRGRGCKLWKGSEVFATDDNPPELLDRLRSMNVELITVGPVDWDNLNVWRVEAMKRLPINRWFRGAERVSHASLMLSAAMEGKSPREAMRWIRNAATACILDKKQTRWGALYSLSKGYYPRKQGRRYHGKDTSPQPGGQLPEAEQAGSGVD